MPYNLSSWLQHLEALSTQRERQPLSRVRGERFERLSRIAKKLDVLDITSPVITVAGTNGKGSCVTLLASIYRAAGYRVGSFTSPHLLRYNERIQINLKPCEDQTLCDALDAVEKAREDALLGYFEFTTLAGLLIFKAAQVDVMVLEVGLGGRLDPVNLVDADVALISSIDLDHIHILGNTIEAIAFEKAGIMRSKKPCVWGDPYLPANVKDYATKLNTPLLVYQKDFDSKRLKDQGSKNASWSFSNATHCLENLPIPRITYLPNAACALETVDLLQKRLPVSRPMLEKGLREVSVSGRFQIVEGAPKTIFDVAHNPASAQLLANNLKAYSIQGKVHMVMAILSTKDIEGILSPLLDIVDHWYLGEFKTQKCAPAGEIAHSLHNLSKKNHCVFETVEKAYTKAQQATQLNDVIVVAGSFHTVAAVMALNER